MTREFNSYTTELVQVKAGLTAAVSQLSEKAILAEQKKTSLFTQLVENTVRRLHLPWYQDGSTKAHSALLQAQKKLDILKRIRDLEIERISDAEWHASISTVNEKGVMDTVFLTHKIRHERVGRSQWSRSEYSGGRVSRQTFRFDKVYDLVNTYEWVIKDALKQRAKNIS